MEEIMWRCIDKMKDLNIFFPEPDLLKPFLYIKDLEFECRAHSSLDTLMDVNEYELIVDGIFKFIEFGVFVSPELIDDLCNYLRCDKERSDHILQCFNERRKHDQNRRRQ